MKKKLIAFDMDSTLIQCEVIDELARYNSKYDEVSNITKSAMRGEIDFETSLRKRTRLLKGTPLSFISKFKENLPYTKGLSELITFLKENHFIIVVLSGGFNIFAKKIVETFNLDEYATNELEVKNNTLTGELVGEIITAEKKAEYLIKYADMYDVPIVNTAAVGDGANDLLMISKSAVGIAFCAKPTVKNLAPFFVDEADLEKIIPILQAQMF